MFTHEIALKGVMSRKTKLPDDEVAWLKQFHNTYSHKELADRYDVCVDTLKRILMRLNLQYFPGAKYQIKPSPKNGGGLVLTVVVQNPDLRTSTVATHA